MCFHFKRIKHLANNVAKAAVWRDTTGCHNFDLFIFFLSWAPRLFESAIFQNLFLIVEVLLLCQDQCLTQPVVSALQPWWCFRAGMKRFVCCSQTFDMCYMLYVVLCRRALTKTADVKYLSIYSISGMKGVGFLKSIFPRYKAPLGTVQWGCHRITMYSGRNAVRLMRPAVCRSVMIGEVRNVL